MIANIIGGIVFIGIAIAFYPYVMGEINEAINSSLVASANASGTTPLIESPWGATVLQLVPGFFILLLLSIGFGLLYMALKKSGVFDAKANDALDSEELDKEELEYDDEYSEEEFKKIKPKESTKKPLPTSTITEDEIIRSEFD